MEELIENEQARFLRRGQRGGCGVQPRKAFAEMMKIWDAVNFRPWRRTWKAVCPRRDSWGQFVLNQSVDKNNPFL